MSGPQVVLSVFRAMKANPAGFRASLTTPYIVWRAPAHEGSESGSWAMTATGAPLNRPRPGEALVYQVAKRTDATNPFPMGVTLGRVESNDLVLDDASVSRFHAWLQQDERTKQWSLTDAESRNGTWVSSVKCEPRQRVPLTDGCVIRLGDADLQFLLPDAFIDWLNGADVEPKK